jgi:hypothetical protein
MLEQALFQADEAKLLKKEEELAQTVEQNNSMHCNMQHAAATASGSALDGRGRGTMLGCSHIFPSAPGVVVAGGPHDNVACAIELPVRARRACHALGSPDRRVGQELRTQRQQVDVPTAGNFR